MVQSLAQSRASNFTEWYTAASSLQLQTFNTMYADADGNIFYLYNGTVAKRKTGVDWTKPVDGSDPELEWATGRRMRRVGLSSVGPQMSAIKMLSSRPPARLRPNLNTFSAFYPFYL